MYYLTKILKVLRVPPERFNEPLKEVALELARDQFERTFNKEIGMILSVNKVEHISPGKIIPGDGGTYHLILFEALTFKPVEGEIVEGEVMEITKFGFFMRIGPSDALCHISQMSDKKNRVRLLPGKVAMLQDDFGRKLKQGDRVRAKIQKAAIEINSMKIAVTLRGEGLGPIEWIRNPIKEEEKAKVESEKKRKRRRTRK